MEEGGQRLDSFNLKGWRGKGWWGGRQKKSGNEESGLGDWDSTASLFDTVASGVSGEMKSGWGYTGSAKMPSRYKVRGILVPRACGVRFARRGVEVRKHKGTSNCRYLEL